MAKRSKFLYIDFSNFSEYAEKLDKLGADLKECIGDAMDKAGKQVQEDVERGIQDANLPRQGKYHGKAHNTEHSVITNVTTEWHGSYGTIDLGFDKTKPGAGGFLITGTPKMQPDAQLASIFQKKSYVTKINKQIKQDLQKKIDERMGG